MFDSTVNELKKYSMNKHKDAEDHLTLDELIVLSKNSFHKDQPIREAAAYLVKEKCTGLSVVNSEGELVGFLSEKDCLEHMFNDVLNKAPLGSVGDYMTKDVITFRRDSGLYNVIENFISKPYQVYPIIEGKKNIGYVNRRDILGALIVKGENL